MRERLSTLALVQHFVSRDLVEIFDVGNLESTDGLNGRCQRGISLAAPSPPWQLSSGGPQRSKDLRTIETLPCTVLTKTHRSADLVANITGATGFVPWVGPASSTSGCRPRNRPD